MHRDEKRFLGLYAAQWLCVVTALIVVVAAWLLWVRPVVTLAYYRHSSVAAARSGLHSESELVRISAARALGGWGAPANDAVPELIIALNDDSPRVAADAAWALGGILSSQASNNSPFQSQAITALLEALEHDDGEVRRYAAYSFSQMRGASQAAVPRLAELLDDDHMAYMAARALGEIGPASKAAVPKMAALLRSSHSGERAEAARALSRLQPLPADVISVIEDLLLDYVDFVRAAARDALNELDSTGGSR